ncbi:MAG: chemotaxis protein CheW [Bacillota bacterium]
MPEQIVTFQLAGQVYSLDINNVREIIRLQPMMQIPESPDYIAGIISLREIVIPVIDLRRKFDLSKSDDLANSRIIIMDVNGTLVGIEVDAVLEVLQIEEKEIEPVPALAAGVEVNFQKGIVQRKGQMIMLLNGAQLLMEKDLDELKREES